MLRKVSILAFQIASLGLTVGGSKVAWAEEIPVFFSGVRPMGMGDAFTAVANDENAIWANPAGISRTRKARSRSVFNTTKFPNIIAGANANGRAFYKGYSNAADQSVEAVVSEAGDLGDKPFWARAAAFPVTMFDVGRDAPMAFGLISNTTAKVIVPKDTPDTARIEAISDLGGVLTAATQDRSNRFNMGLQIRPTARYAYEDRIPSASLLNKKDMQERTQNGANKSQAVAIDAGILYTVADFWFPTIGLAVLNAPTGCRENYLNPFTKKRERVCGTVYQGSFANEEALSTVDATDLRVGISITPRLARSISTRLSLDMHHIALGDASASYGLMGIDVGKMVHAGFEIFTGNPLDKSNYSFRAGYSQGFATAGFSADFGLIMLEFATYGRDVSSNVSPLEDRRYLGSFSFRIF